MSLHSQMADNFSVQSKGPGVPASVTELPANTLLPNLTSLMPGAISMSSQAKQGKESVKVVVGDPRRICGGPAAFESLSCSVFSYITGPPLRSSK